MSISLVEIKPSRREGKKWAATFVDEETGRERTVHFGSSSHDDFTIHRDPDRRERYLDRHRGREDWSNPTTPGALSRWILWNKPTLRASVSDFKRRFGL